MERTGTSVHHMASTHQHKAEVMIAGEQLRERLHDSKLIKDRRCYLRTYPNCLVAQELIDWLISHKEAPDRDSALHLMQHLMDHDIVHHVCDKYSVFRDAKLLYRFRRDDGTFPFSKEVKVFVRGQSLYEHLVSGKESFLQPRAEQGVVYQRSFPGCQLIDWLLQNGEVDCRSQGLELCCALLEHGIIQHVAQKHHFFDGALLYQFCVNFRRRRRLTELLGEGGAWEAGGAGGAQSPDDDDPSDGPFLLHKTTPEEGKGSFLSVQPGMEVRVMSAVHRGGVSWQQTVQDGCFPLSLQLHPPHTRCNPKSVLMRTVTCEELLNPGSPYIRKVLRVQGDAVGWGFVVRGAAPCYVQAVEPGGPAAAAGVKVRQFVCQVNGRHVLHLDYRVVTKLVMTGPRMVVLEMMEPLD